MDKKLKWQDVSRTLDQSWSAYKPLKDHLKSHELFEHASRKYVKKDKCDSLHSCVVNNQREVTLFLFSHVSCNFVDGLPYVM